MLVGGLAALVWYSIPHLSIPLALTTTLSLTLLGYPLLFTLDRGNIEGLLFLAIAACFAFYVLMWAATLAGIFCVPPSYNGIVDPSAELPGPGAVSLPGTAQLFVPTTVPGATTTSTTVATTTTTTLLPIPCGGVFPVCVGNCPVGTCTAGGIGQLCTCQ